jgi:hypothetical protein
LRSIRRVVERPFECATDVLGGHDLAFAYLSEIDACGVADRVNQGRSSHCIEDAAGERAFDGNKLQEFTKRIPETKGNCPGS